jgi:hypothetical protein
MIYDLPERGEACSAQRSWLGEGRFFDGSNGSRLFRSWRDVRFCRKGAERQREQRMRLGEFSLLLGAAALEDQYDPLLRTGPCDALWALFADGLGGTQPGRLCYGRGPLGSSRTEARARSTSYNLKAFSGVGLAPARRRAATALAPRFRSASAPSTRQGLWAMPPTAMRPVPSGWMMAAMETRAKA